MARPVIDETCFPDYRWYHKCFKFYPNGMNRFPNVTISPTRYAYYFIRIAISGEPLKIYYVGLKGKPFFYKEKRDA